MDDMEVMKDCIRQILLGLQYLVLKLITLILSELEENEQMIICYMKLLFCFYYRNKKVFFIVTSKVQTYWLMKKMEISFLKLLILDTQKGHMMVWQRLF